MDEDDIEFRKVVISPIELLRQALDMMGDDYWLLLGIVIVGLFIASLVPFGILVGPMACGIYMCYSQRLRSEPVRFETLFNGFDHFAESLTASVLLMVGQAVLIIPVYLIVVVGVIGVIAGQGGVMSVVAGVATVVAYVGVLVVAMVVPALFMFVFPLIVDRQMAAIPAIKVSARAAMANLGGILLMLIVYSLISLVASCLCLIPALLFMPVQAAAMILVYREVFDVSFKAAPPEIAPSKMV